MAARTVTAPLGNGRARVRSTCASKSRSTMSLNVQPAPRMIMAPTANRSAISGSGQPRLASANPHPAGKKQKPRSDWTIEARQSPERLQHRWHQPLDPIAADVREAGGSYGHDGSPQRPRPELLRLHQSHFISHSRRISPSSQAWYKHMPELNSGGLEKQVKPAARLHVDASLAEGAELDLNPSQTHYLRSVLRLEPGRNLLLFNGRDGEWLAQISDLGKRKTAVSVLTRRRGAEARAGSVAVIRADQRRSHRCGG